MCLFEASIFMQNFENFKLSKIIETIEVQLSLPVSKLRDADSSIN